MEGDDFYNKLWIGLNDEAQEDAFVWTDGSNVTYEKWWGRNPDGGRRENCVAIWFAKGWVDQECSHLCGFICELH